MIEELKELLEMQKEFDKAVLKKYGIEIYPYEEMRIALGVELGELMQEFPSKFKFWKKSAIDNRKKGLEEYVDCLSFKLSIYNYKQGNLKGIDCNYNHYKLDGLTLYDAMKYTLELDSLNTFFELGHKLGFTWEEIYVAYKKKHQIKYERLKNGY